MTTWTYNDQDGQKFITEAEIIRTYYPWWTSQMKKVNKEHLISYANCIEDFATIHWAWKVDDVRS